jgi:hypothetical protein
MTKTTWAVVRSSHPSDQASPDKIGQDDAHLCRSTLVRLFPRLPSPHLAARSHPWTPIAPRRSALLRIQRIDNWSVHELLSLTGTTIREFYGSNGVVFGVRGTAVDARPRQLFGSWRFNPLSAGLRDRPARAQEPRAPAIDDTDLIARRPVTRDRPRGSPTCGLSFRPALPRDVVR